jgi:hypothetical protein
VASSRSYYGGTAKSRASRKTNSLSELGSDLERGRRRTPHPITARQLAEALNLSLIERAALLANGQVATAVSTLPLPMPLTSFVGRERELTKLRRLLESTRLLTVPDTLGRLVRALELEGAPRLALESVGRSVSGRAT